VRVYVVFEQNGYAVQCSAHTSRAAFAVKLCGDFERVRVDLYNRVEPRAFAVNRLNARKITLCDRTRGEFSRTHTLLQLCDCDFFKLEFRRARSISARIFDDASRNNIGCAGD
jgi:hypothetical protein